MDQKEIDAIEKFAKRLTGVVDELERYSGYLNLSPESVKIKDEAMKILKKKSDKVVNAETKKELKKVLKVNKLLESEGL